MIKTKEKPLPAGQAQKAALSSIHNHLKSQVQDNFDRNTHSSTSHDKGKAA